MNDLAAKGKSICEMTQAQLAVLQSLTENGNDPVRSLARNVLITNGLINYQEPIIFPDETKSLKQRTRYLKTVKPSGLNYLKVFPNPANQFIIVDYNLKEKYKVGQNNDIYITTLDGKRVENKVISKQQDKVLINCSTLPSGSYYCTISVARKPLESLLFVIVQ